MSNVTLENIISGCQDRGILLDFNNSCCDECNLHELEESLESQDIYRGYVYCDELSVKKSIKNIVEKGDSLFYFGFGGKSLNIRKEVGFAFASICKKLGYNLDWNETPAMKVGVYLKEKDLPKNLDLRKYKEE